MQPARSGGSGRTPRKKFCGNFLRSVRAPGRNWSGRFQANFPTRARGRRGRARGAGLGHPGPVVQSPGDPVGTRGPWPGPAAQANLVARHPRAHARPRVRGGNFGRKLRGEGGGAAGARAGAPESRTPRDAGRNRGGPGDGAEPGARPAASSDSCPRRARAWPDWACAWARASASPWRSPPAPRCGRPDTRVPSAPAGAGRGRAARPGAGARCPGDGRPYKGMG